MIPEDEKRLEELLDEIKKIFTSNNFNFSSYSLIIKDINKELIEIHNRNCH